MGGFEGGDEGGFWDEDSISILIDKQNNLQAKKTKIKQSIHTSDSGYSVRAYTEDKNSYSTISFVLCKCDTFSIEGCEGISLQSNKIYKAYKALLELTHDTDIVDFFSEYKVLVTHGNTLPPQNNFYEVASFMYLLKEVCNLVISNKELLKIENSLSLDS